MVRNMAINTDWHHWLLPIAIVATIALVLFVLIRQRGFKNPRIRGAALPGRAQILSVEQIGNNETPIISGSD